MEWPIKNLRKIVKPILKPSKKDYESFATYNATTIEKKGKIYLFYRAEKGDKIDYISTICLATSKDGIKFKKDKQNPIIFPTKDYEKKGCEDPRIVKLEGKYYMTYTGYSDKGIHLCLAVSKDLIKWRKLGIIIKNTKAGAIIPKKINGRYYMYHGDKSIILASSGDLIKWKNLETVLKPRKNNFDSRIVESGPSPIIADKGIFLVYNGSNKKIQYFTGYALFDKKNPGKLLARTSKPILSPTKPWEKNGKVNEVIFTEGIIIRKNKCFLYYGAADKYQGVAIGKWQ